MVDPELSGSTNTDNTFDNLALPDSNALNYTSDTQGDGSDGVTNAVDQIFKYAKDTTDILGAVGVIPGKNGSATQAVKSANGTIQPTGANPVQQTPMTTTAVSWVKAHPGTAVAVGAGIILGGVVLYKLLK